MNSIFQMTDRVDPVIWFWADILIILRRNCRFRELEDELGHMILSPRSQGMGLTGTPKTIEAFALYHSDLVSARLNQAITNFSEKHDGRWTKWDPFWKEVFY